MSEVHKVQLLNVWQENKPNIL